MSGVTGSSADHALLARLNALKRSTIDLNATKPAFESTLPRSDPIDPAPARALHSDLLSRFKDLAGQSDTCGLYSSSAAGGMESHLLADEDEKTVEELMAELGPEDSWSVPKDEESQIQALLDTASATLKASEFSNESQSPRPDNQCKTEEIENIKGESEHDDIYRDATVARKEALAKVPEASEDDFDEEADEYLAQILKELKNQPQGPTLNTDDIPVAEAQPNQELIPHSSGPAGLHFPSAPAKELDLPPSYTEATGDDELAARFANLGLPAVPTTIHSQTPKPPSKGTNQNKYTDDEIDSWCIICNDDATLRCIGCDGDLYCVKCWLEGHKGEDAGYEERTHKAVQYNKGGGMKKQPARRTMMSA